MKNMLKIWAVCISVALSPIAKARQLGDCMIESLNGKERKELAKWIFFGMSAHPDMSSYGNVTQTDRITTDKTVANLISRLLLEDCLNEFKVVAYDNMAIDQAFSLMGETAMQELMNSESVERALTNFIKYIEIKN